MIELRDLARPAGIELIRVRLRMRRPLVASHGAETERWLVLVRAFDAAGEEGWGECPALRLPTYTSEWHEGAWLVLRDLLAPDAVAGAASKVAGHPMAASAIETALVDLSLRRVGRSLADAIGATRSAVQSCAVVGMAASIDALLGAVSERVAAGHRSVKLKVAPGWDVEPLRAVRSTWPELSLAADCNGSYEGHAPEDLSGLDLVGLSYLEQPFAAEDLPAHARLRERLDTPIALDESFTSARSVETICLLGAADALNLKPARLGGLLEARAAHDLASDAGLALWCGGMIESAVGRAAALAVAALPGCNLPADLGPSACYFESDVADPFELEVDGSLRVPVSPGVGRAPSADLLDPVVVERCTVGGA